MIGASLQIELLPLDNRLLFGRLCSQTLSAHRTGCTCSISTRQSHQTIQGRIETHNSSDKHTADKTSSPAPSSSCTIHTKTNKQHTGSSPWSSTIYSIPISITLYYNHTYIEKKGSYLRNTRTPQRRFRTATCRGRAVVHFVLAFYAGSREFGGFELFLAF